jgi:adenylate kinase family enzyme
MIQLSTGDMLREAVAKGTPVGLKAKAVMERGELVSDAIVSALIGERLDAAATKGAIFDGFPRTGHQAEALEILLAERGRKLDHVIELVVDEEALVDRITGRFTCANAARPITTASTRPRSKAPATSAAGPSSSAAPTTMSRRCARAWPNIAPRPRRSCLITRKRAWSAGSTAWPRSNRSPRRSTRSSTARQSRASLRA